MVENLHSPNQITIPYLGTLDCSLCLVLRLYACENTAAAFSIAVCLTLCRFQCIAPASMAMRAGCVLISYEALVMEEGMDFEEICNQVVEEARVWAAGHGLLDSSDDLVSIQVCSASGLVVMLICYAMMVL